MTQNRYNLNEDFRKQAPNAGPSPRFDIGEFKTHTLENGLQLIVVENHKLPKLTIQLLVDHEPVVEGDLAGLADLTSELMVRGTDSRSKLQIDEAIDAIGAKFNSASSFLMGSVLKKFQHEFLSIMSDVLLHPTFSEREFEKLKLRYASRLESLRNEPAEIAYNVATAVNFGKGHPYADLLTQSTLENISVDTCRSFYETYWRPNCAYLAVVGDTTMEEVINDIAPYFASWQPATLPRQEYPVPAAPEGYQFCIVDRPGSVQTEIRYTYPISLHPKNMDRIPVGLANAILGGGVFSGYLMSNLREDKAYTYGVRSMLNVDHVCSEFKVSTSVGTEYTIPAVKEIIHEINRLRTTDVDQDHLELATNSKIGAFARSLENSQTLAGRVLNMLRFDLPESFYASYTEKLGEVDQSQIREMAMNYFLSDQANIVLVGDYEKIADAIAASFPDALVSKFDIFGKKLN